MVNTSLSEWNAHRFFRAYEYGRRGARPHVEMSIFIQLFYGDSFNSSFWKYSHKMVSPHATSVTYKFSFDENCTWMPLTRPPYPTHAILEGARSGVTSWRSRTDITEIQIRSGCASWVISSQQIHLGVALKQSSHEGRIRVSASHTERRYGTKPASNSTR